MKHRILFLTFFLSCFAAVHASAELKRYTVETVPDTEILNYSYVTDLSSVISPQVRDSLNFLCRFANDSLGAEIAVVTLPGIDTGAYGSLHEFGTELYNTWNLGDKKTERGLLILLVTNPEEREISFVTGYGLEGLLPDVYCKRIQANIMVPLMKQGDYGQGLLEGVKASCGIISGEVLIPESEEDDDWAEALVVIALIFLGVLFIAVAAMRAEKKRKEKMGKSLTCTTCGVKGNMKYDRYVVLVRPTTRSVGKGRYYFICQNCGGENFKDVVIPKDGSGTGFAGPVGGGTLIGGGGGRSFGSFGGGFSGGGGASTRF